MKTACLFLLPIAAQGARYGLLRVGTHSDNIVDYPHETAQRSLYEEDFQAFFRGLLGGPLNAGMSMGASAGLSLSMMPTAVGLSMPLAAGLSMSMSSLALGPDASSADPTSSNDGDISDLISFASEEVEENSTPVTPGTNSTTVTAPVGDIANGDVAQTTDSTSSFPNGSEKKSSKTTAVVVGALSVAGVALLAGVVVRKKMAHGNSDASVGESSLPNSVL